MYLIDFIFTLPSNVFCRVKFAGEKDFFVFTTGAKKTGAACAKLVNDGKSKIVVNKVCPLWHAQELYIECC